MSSCLVEALLQDLDALLDVAQLLTVALYLVLDVCELAGRVHLQLFQHALLTLTQETVEALKCIADSCTQTLGRGLKKRGRRVNKKDTKINPQVGYFYYYRT